MLKSVVLALLSVIELFLFLRAILSWFGDLGGISDFLITVTEPIIMPMRILFDKLNIETGMIPIDLPYLATWILLSIIESVLF